MWKIIWSSFDGTRTATESEIGLTRSLIQLGINGLKYWNGTCECALT